MKDRKRRDPEMAPAKTESDAVIEGNGKKIK
jgi:hypothetical protein